MCNFPQKKVQSKVIHTICGVPITISYCLHAIVKVMKLVDFSDSFSVYFALE